MSSSLSEDYLDIDLTPYSVTYSSPFTSSNVPSLIKNYNEPPSDSAYWSMQRVAPPVNLRNLQLTIAQLSTLTPTKATFFKTVTVDQYNNRVYVHSGIIDSTKSQGSDMTKGPHLTVNFESKHFYHFWDPITYLRTETELIEKNLPRTRQSSPRQLIPLVAYVDVFLEDEGIISAVEVIFLPPCDGTSLDSTIDACSHTGSAPEVLLLIGTTTGTVIIVDMNQTSISNANLRSKEFNEPSELRSLRVLVVVRFGDDWCKSGKIPVDTSFLKTPTSEEDLLNCSPGIACFVSDSVTSAIRSNPGAFRYCNWRSEGFTDSVWILHTNGLAVELSSACLQSINAGISTDRDLRKATGKSPASQAITLRHRLINDWDPRYTSTPFPFCSIEGIEKSNLAQKLIETHILALAAPSRKNYEGGPMRVTDGSFCVRCKPDPIEILETRSQLEKSFIMVGDGPSIGAFVVRVEASPFSTRKVVVEVASRLAGAALDFVKRTGWGWRGGEKIVAPKETIIAPIAVKNHIATVALELGVTFSCVTTDPTSRYAACYCVQGRIYIFDLCSGIVCRVMKSCRAAECAWYYPTVDGRKMLLLAVHLRMRGVLEIFSMHQKRRVGAVRVGPNCTIMRTGFAPSSFLMIARKPIENTTTEVSPVLELFRLETRLRRKRNLDGGFNSEKDTPLDISRLKLLHEFWTVATSYKEQSCTDTEYPREDDSPFMFIEAVREGLQKCQVVEHYFLLAMSFSMIEGDTPAQELEMLFKSLKEVKNEVREIYRPGPNDDMILSLPDTESILPSSSVVKEFIKDTEKQSPGSLPSRFLEVGTESLSLLLSNLYITPAQLYNYLELRMLVLDVYSSLLPSSSVPSSGVKCVNESMNDVARQICNLSNSNSTIGVESGFHLTAHLTTLVSKILCSEVHPGSDLSSISAPESYMGPYMFLQFFWCGSYRTKYVAQGVLSTQFQERTRMLGLFLFERANAIPISRLQGILGHFGVGSEDLGELFVNWFISSPNSHFVAEFTATQLLSHNITITQLETIMGNISLSDTPYCDSCHSFVSLIVLLAVKVHHISDGNEGKQSRNWILQSISRLAVLNIIMQVPADDTSSVFRPGLLFRDIYFEDQCNGLQTKDALFCCLSLVRPEILSSCISSFAEEVRRAEESGGQEYRKQFMLTGECDILQNTNPKIEVDFGVTMYPEMLVSLSLRRAEFLSGYYTSISPLKLRESVRFSEVTPTNSAFLSICQVELWTTFKGFENSIEMVLKRTGDGEMYSLDSSKIHELSSGIICMEGLHKRLCQASEKDLIWKKARDKRGNISEEDRRRVCRHICGSLQVLACAAAAASTLLGPLRLIIEELNSCNSLLSYSSFRAIFGPAVTNRAVLLYLDVCKELVQLIGSIFAHNLISEPSVFRVQGMIDFSQWSCSVLKDAVVSDPVGDAVSKFISWCIDVDDQEVFPCIFPSVRSSLAAFSVFVAESSVEGALLIITDVGCIIDTFAFFLSLNGDVTKSILGHLQWDSLFFPEALCLLDEFDRNRMSLSIPSPKESDASQPEFRSEMYRVYQENRFKFHLLLFSTVFDYLSAEHDISEDNNYLLDTAQTTMDIAKGVLRALTTEVSDSMEIASFCTFITRGQFVDGQYVFSNIVSKVNAAYCCANILRRWLIQTEAVIGMLAQKPLNSKQVQARNLLQLQELLTELQSMKTSAVKKWIEGARFSSNGWAPPEKAPWLERALSDPSLHTLRSQWLQCAVDIACFSADYSSSFPPDEMELIEELPTIWKSLKKILRC